ncbi:MAG: hypothetical protein QXS79_04010 [Candidatus Bathyarchaeia archaeon]
MEGRHVKREPILLLFMERLVGLVLLIIGVILLHGAYAYQASLGGASSSFFMAISVALIFLGLLMLLSKTE